MKYLQVRMEDGEWKRVAQVALDKGVSISTLVKGWIDEKLNPWNKEVIEVSKVVP